MIYLLQRFNTRFVLGPAMITWAVICASTAGVTTWQGLLVQRFCLGTQSQAYALNSSLSALRIC